MSIQSQFTPEEIAKLVAGEAISKSSKVGTVKPANEIKEKEGLPAETFTPKTSIPINERVAVTRPVIRDSGGQRISPEGVVGVSKGTFDRIDEDRRAAAQKLKDEFAAAQEIQSVASPANLLNQLNGLRRIVEKQAKEIDKLKKSNG